MQLKHCIGQEFNVIVMKTAHRRNYLLKTLVSVTQEIFASMVKTKSVLKFPEFSIWKILLNIFTKKNRVNVSQRIEEAFYNISMYFYNKNVLEYAEIARSGAKYMILKVSLLYTIFIALVGFLI